MLFDFIMQMSPVKLCVCDTRCPSWSEDESICVRSVNNELHFYENNDFSKISGEA